MNNQAANVVRMWDKGSLEYCEPTLKQTAHRLAQQLLKKFAIDCLGLQLSDFDVRSNMGGIAVSGEVTLHTDKVYIQISQSSLGHTIMWRTCTGRKDYTGGHNRWGNVTELLSTPANRKEFASKVQQACG